MGTILVVDDQLELRTLFSRVLQNQGHTVIAVADGQEALRSTESWLPDVVLLDLAMPQMDGLAFLRAARKRANWANVPVIMLTGLMSADQTTAAQELGVTDRLIKGEFTTRELRARVAKCLAAKMGTATNTAA